MKISRFVIGIVAAACAVVACQEPAELDKTPGELKSFAFLAEDNDTLANDVVAESIEAQMVLRTKMGGKGVTLVATLTAGENDVINVNGVDIVDGKDSVDCSYPIDIIVTNSKSGIATAYEVKVGKVLGTFPTKVAAYQEPGAENGMLNMTDIMLDPKDEKPVTVYMRKLATDTYSSASVAKWNGTSFELVGKSGIADNSERTVSNPVLIGHDKDNNLIVVYGGAEVASKFTAKVFKGTDWVLMGTAGFADKYTVAYGQPEIMYSPGNGQPGFFFTDNVKNTAPYRNGILAYYDGEDWGIDATNLLGFPKYGANGGSDGMFYRAAVCNTKDAGYVVSSSNQYGYMVNRLAKGGVSVVVEDFKPEGEAYGIPTNLSVKEGPDGTIYILAGLSKNAKMQVYKLDEANKTLVPYGAPLTCTVSSTGAVKEKVAFGINPISGEMMITRDNEFAVLNPETLDWDFNTARFEADELQTVPKILYDSKGNGYLYVITRDADKKYYNCLYTLGIEQDVLPERE